jgi:response regulator NasT
MAPRLRILLVDRRPERSRGLCRALEEEGYQVTMATGASDLHAQVAELDPDMVIIDTDSPDRDMLEDTRRISRERPKPIVMFVDESDAEAIEQAVQAGVAAYVMQGETAGRVRPVLDLAVAWFREFQSLKSELARYKTSLADRKVIERAKGILMERKGCSEDEAYVALRRLAMNRNQRLIEVARNVIELASVL